jgi:hypothetical protein
MFNYFTNNQVRSTSSTVLGISGFHPVCQPSFLLRNTQHRGIVSDTYKRVNAFYSQIKLRFDHIVGDFGATIFNYYIIAYENTFNPSNNRNDSPINAAKILISFPLFYATLSSYFVRAVFKQNLEITLPAFTWGLLDKYFIKVKRENFGNKPGLEGEIISLNNKTTFKAFVDGIFSDEFLLKALEGTNFSHLVHRREKYNENGNISSYEIIVSQELRHNLNTRLRPFDCPLYSYDFMVAVSTFYSDVNSRFTTKCSMVTKQPDRRVNSEVGLHYFRNHSDNKQFIYHQSNDPKLDNEFHFNTICIIFYVFSPIFGSASSDFKHVTKYGDLLAGNNEITIDLTSLKFVDVFTTLLSMGVRTHRNVEPRESNASTSTPDVPQRRQFSTLSYDDSSHSKKVRDVSRYPIEYFYTYNLSDKYLRVFKDGKHLMVLRV